MPLEQGGGERGNGGGRPRSLNVLGGELAVCSMKPMTGFFRNGAMPCPSSHGSIADTRARRVPARSCPSPFRQVSADRPWR